MPWGSQKNGKSGYPDLLAQTNKPGKNPSMRHTLKIKLLLPNVLKFKINPAETRSKMNIRKMQHPWTQGRKEAIIHKSGSG